MRFRYILLPLPGLIGMETPFPRAQCPGLISVTPPALRAVTSFFKLALVAMPKARSRTHVPIRAGILLQKKTGQVLPCPAVLTFKSRCPSSKGR